MVILAWTLACPTYLRPISVSVRTMSGNELEGGMKLKYILVGWRNDAIVRNTANTYVDFSASGILVLPDWYHGTRP